MALGRTQYAIVEALKNGPITVSEIRRAVGKPGVSSALFVMKQKGLLDHDEVNSIYSLNSQVDAEKILAEGITRKGEHGFVARDKAPTSPLRVVRDMADRMLRIAEEMNEFAQQLEGKIISDKERTILNWALDMKAYLNGV